jgi:hypothetical protein
MRVGIDRYINSDALFGLAVDIGAGATHAKAHG